MYKRPNPNETEEDILKLQEEFFKDKGNNAIEPAAKLIKHNSRESTVKQQDGAVVESSAIQIANTFESIPSNINIGKVIQKVETGVNVSVPSFVHNTGFPTAKRRDLGPSTTKGSIFSQQMKKFKKGPDLPITTKESSDLNKIQVLPQQSYVITGDDKDVIHNENLSLLQQMSPEEILEEREKLLATMDPAIVAFLKTKRNNVVENRNLSIAKQNEAAKDINFDNVLASKEILSMENSDKWLNFDTIESSKLVWMTDCDVPKCDKGGSYEARFDFEGWLQPFSLEMKEGNRSLYHHGDEPGRPGYTLQELFQLCRSSVAQQKIIALNAIANILYLFQYGVYDDVLELPLEQIFFVIRFCLDDNTSPVLNAGIKALRNLFYYHIDETCLDYLLAFGLGQIQPILAVDNSEVDDDNTVNDQQLAETNLVKCLVRTDILKRIKYIINTVKPSIETIIYVLEILIRMARDSDYVVNQIFQCEGLVEGVVKYFVPVITVLEEIQPGYGSPLPQALKFLRIMSGRSKGHASKIINCYHIMDPVASYLANGSYLHSNALKLQIEALHLWSVFVHYNLSLDYFNNLQPIFLRLLDYHVKNTDVSASSYTVQRHVSALLVFLSNVICNNLRDIESLWPLLRDLAYWKWIKQIENLSEFTCGQLQISSSLFYCFTPLMECAYSNVKSMERGVEDFLDKKGFDVITNNIQCCSNLLNNYDVHKTSSNLKTVEASAWKASERVIPYIQSSSCMPFVTVLSNLVLHCDDKIKLKFLKHRNVVKYLNLLNDLPNFFLISNWFTRCESRLIANILKMAIAVQKVVDTSLFYEIAVKSLSIYNREFKGDILIILRNIVFSPSFYSCESLMSNLNIDHKKDLLSQALNNLNNILNVYTVVLNLHEDSNESLLVDVSSGTVMPIDWIYSPIISLYLNQQKTQGTTSEEQVDVIINCLRWIYLYETYFPNLAKAINPTERFCRLACTFLGSDNLFLEPEVHDLLEVCLRHIIKNNEENINFHKPIQGLNNFQDFYTQLLEQYQGVSYGDALFGNFILLPLIQRHDVKYRKTLWSEYAGVVQIFNVTSEQNMCPIELFLNPEESDISLLKCYRRALLTGNIRKHSVFYQIANHHVHSFLSKKKENK